MLDNLIPYLYYLTSLCILMSTYMEYGTGDQITKFLNSVHPSLQSPRETSKTSILEMLGVGCYYISEIWRDDIFHQVCAKFNKIPSRK